MKVYINGYRKHWISPYTIIDYMFFWTDWSKCSRIRNYQLQYDNFVEPPKWVDKLSDYLNPFCIVLEKILKIINPTIRYVKIDHHDTWSMDHTLSYIILPMLKQLKETKHGSPFTEDEDVPDELKSTNAPPKENDWDIDNNHFKRWDWVLGEMIWSFEQQLNDDGESQFYDHSESKLTDDFEESIKKIKVDREGLEAHQKRKSNGFRLFGRYFENLWD